MPRLYKRWPVSGTHRLEVPRVVADKIRRIAKREKTSFQSMAVYLLEQAVIMMKCEALLIQAPPEVCRSKRDSGYVLCQQCDRGKA